jgi:hypothetical protein
MPIHEPYFYAFVRNCGTVDCCAEKINGIFDDFCNQLPKNSEQNSELAASLKGAVANKM